MNNILEMIKNEKVEWKKLGDVCEFNRGQTITKKKVRRGNIPVIAGGKKPAYYHNEFNREGETITVAGSGAYAGFLGYWEESIFLSDAFSIDPNSELIKKYLYYYLSSIQNKIYDLQRGAGVQHVYGKDMSNFIIPIPSLKTQEKIVEILDKFVKYSTELQAELQAELQNRSSQYEYFRDLVLSEDYLNKLSIESYKEKNNKIIIKTLDDIAQINRGSSPRPISRYITEENDGVPWIKIGDAGKNSKYITKTNQKITKEGAKKSRVLKKGDFIISNSMSYGRPYILDLEGAIHDGWASISDYDSVLDSNYLYHYLNTSFVQKYWENKMNSSSVSNLNIEIIKSLPIPILTKDLQLKVSSVLDKFQDLLAETEGLLPKEIEQRQKQYEYFREKLLTFDKDVVSQPASQPASQPLIASCYFEILREACEISGVENFTQIKVEKLSCNAKVTKLAGYEFTKYVKYEEKGKIIALRGLNVKKGKIILDNVKYIDGSDLTKLNRSKLIKDDILFTYVGTIGEVGLVEENDKFYLAPNVALIRVDKNVIRPKYLLYLLQSSEFKHKEINRWLESSSMKNLTMENIRKFNITIPPLPVQDHIVKILDKFDTLVNDLNNGLPKEIELRQKQYEYYRDLLLNFRK